MIVNIGMYERKTALEFHLPDYTVWEVVDITPTEITIDGRSFSCRVHMMRNATDTAWVLDVRSLQKLQDCYDTTEWPDPSATPTAVLLEQFINKYPPLPEMLDG